VRDDRAGYDRPRREYPAAGQGQYAARPPRQYEDAPEDFGATAQDLPLVEGVLEIHPKGYGFLRDPKNSYLPGKDDPFVTGQMIERFKLREGVMIQGGVADGPRSQGPRLRQIALVEGKTVEEYQQIKSFDELTAVNPFEQIKLETGPTPVTMRVMDLLTPIGKGQRALIVAPPRTGKTMLLQEIANAVSTNHPEIHLIVLLIDERPEEVTEMKRRIKGEVIASSMDRELESHVRLSQLVFERAKRMTERGRDVFVLLDSITRTARAFNKWTNTGRTGSGGLDVRAMDIPKKMFGTARRFDEGGSLTVVGTALIETNSRMDDVIFEEFKGTGNMEMVLNRSLADRRIFPAIDISKSGTRREELIMSPETLEGVTMLRRSLLSLGPVEAMDQLTRTLARFPSNREFLQKVKSVM
jgi:transcription termination factor Rho